MAGDELTSGLQLQWATQTEFPSVVRLFEFNCCAIPLTAAERGSGGIFAVLAGAVAGPDLVTQGSDVDVPLTDGPSGVAHPSDPCAMVFIEIAADVARPKLNKDIFPDATIREVVGELTSRRGGGGVLRTFTSTADVEGQQVETAAGGRELARSLQSHLQGRRGSGIGEVVLEVCGQNRAVNIHSSANHRANTLWKEREAKEKGYASYDHDSDWQVVSREAVRQKLWEKDLPNPTLALDGALRRVAVWDNADSLTAGGSRA